MDQERFTSLGGHLEDLRQTLIRVIGIVGIGFIVTLCFYEPLFKAIGNPDTGIPLIVLGPLEGMATVFKVCFWVALAGTSPIWAYFILQFILPALRKNERTSVFVFASTSLLLLLLGGAFAYLITIPFANRYLAAFNSVLGTNMWTLSHYIDYTLILFLGHLVAFELCLILLFLVHMGTLSAEWLREKRRYMIVFAFILGAILTPPDILTQFMLAIPLIILYEVAILYAVMRERKRARIMSNE